MDHQHLSARIRALINPGTLEADQFRQLVETTVAGPAGCIIWAGHVDRGGYGVARVNRRTTVAHRALYALITGTVARGLHLDHLCHTRDLTCPGGPSCLHRRCVNPHHLEAVTSRENTLRSLNTLAGINARKTHCVHGHPFSDDNTHVEPDGSRRCRTCAADRARAYRGRKAGAR